MVRLVPSFERDDAGWDQDYNFHVYEQAYAASTPGPGSVLTWDTAAAASSYSFGLARAKAMDRARRAIIRAAHAKHEDVMGSAFVRPEAYSRSVDGIDAAPDASIKL